MDHDVESKEVEPQSETPAEQKKESGEQPGEFKLTVRKLEMPVRIRGVLAE